MTRGLLLVLWLLLGPALPAHAWEWTPGSVLVFAYHDVVDDLHGNADPYTVDSGELVSHLAWLRAHGYTPVSLSAVIDSRSGGPPLPAKAVLLTFDDGFASHYTRVYPLLKAFNYPAVVSPIGIWMEGASGSTITFDEGPVPREKFLTWEQLREMADSGLVEIATQTYDLHHGVQGNPQGNKQSAATTRRYDPAAGRYEDDAAYRARVRADLKRAADQIQRETGRRPRAVVWPYGSYNGNASAIATELGMPIGFGLGDGPNDAHQPLSRLKRVLIAGFPTVREFAGELTAPRARSPVRVVHVDLDYVYSPDPAEQERNLGALLERVKALGVNTVYLQAYADPDGNGAADAVYFPNRHLPVRADLFNRAAWQLRTRVGVQVFAWMPLLAFELPPGHPARGLRVEAAGGAPGVGYPRLSPFAPEARRVIREIYQDLARYAYFDGVLFHDDGTLSDFEDASPWALEAYARDWGLSASVAAIRDDPEQARRWAELKTRHLIAMTDELTAAMERDRAPLKRARNLYAQVALDPEAQAWFAQSLPAFLAAYDQTAIMAMPYLEGADDPENWLTQLVARVAATPGGLERSVFELQSRDWAGDRGVAGAELAGWMRRLQFMGAIHFGYYPDDFPRNEPPLGAVRPELSLRSDPGGR